MRFKIEAARRDHSKAACSWEQAVKKCALEKVEKARMEMKKHQISLGCWNGCERYDLGYDGCH
jgi:hypothetical protein